MKTSTPTPELPTDGRAPVQHFYVATFAIKGTDSKVSNATIEVPRDPAQKPADVMAAVWAAVKKKFPKTPRENIRRLGGVIESRPAGEVPAILIRAGETIRQLFPDGSDFEASRKVGTVVFDGVKRDVVLRHLRSKSMFSLTLSLSGQPAINFSEQVTVMRLTSELPKIIAEMLGDVGTELKLHFRAPVPSAPAAK